MKTKILLALLVFAFLPVIETSGQIHECTNPTTTIDIALHSFEFQPNVIQVDKAECVRFNVENAADNEHHFVLEDASGEVWFTLTTPGNGDNATIAVQMPNEDVKLPFYCDVPGHKDAGMQGEVIVGSIGASGDPSGNQKDGGASDEPGIAFGFGWLAALAALIIIPSVRYLK